MPRPKKVTAILERLDDRWRAYVDGNDAVAVTSHNSRSARRRLTELAQKQYGDAAVVEFKLNLPKDVLAELEQHLAQEEQLQYLVEAIPASRINIAQRLLAMNLTQQEVADLLGLSQSHLALILRRDATQAPPVRPTTNRRPGRT